MMKKIFYILFAAVLAFTACQRVDIESPVPVTEEDAPKVTITFPVSIPNDGPSTRAMGNVPTVQNIYVAVFGGSGYFNEWVPAEYKVDESATQYATANETVYRIKVKLTTSASRLSLHIIANSPMSEPPITGISSNDLETVVMSKVRSHIDNQPNDAYWQRIVLPFGVKDSVIVTNGQEQPFIYNGDRYPTALTQAQFEHWNPIPLIRNFARIRVQKDASLTDVTIDKIGLAYAPAEGPVAPILPNTYTGNQWGEYIPIADDDETTTFWRESFMMAYEGKTIEQLGQAPYNFKGYSPVDLAIGTYPSSLDEMTSWSASTWEDDYLYVYERAKPRTGQKRTRILIHAQNGVGEPYKYYALDMADSNGEPLALLRNFTYTVTVKKLAAGTGESTIAKAADATAADVSSDIRTSDLTEVSDGIALIAASYIDTTAIKAGTYSVMYRFIPDVNSPGVVANNPSTTTNPVGVSMKFGYNDGTGFVEGASSANGNAFASNPVIETNGDGTAKLYVRNGNGWSVATAAQIADTSVEKWGHIQYTTVGTAGSYFDLAYTKVIRVIGTKPENLGGGQVYRDVQVNLIPRKNMIVKCLDKYIDETVGASETLRIIIPNDITRSMFPLEFKIQAEAASLTPRDGDNLPVQSGKSIVPNKETQSAFFFIKTLTRDDYDAASDTTINGVQMKYFDCKFKSTKAASATTVYVYNEYFNIASDDFDNYTKRKFTASSPGNLGVGHKVNFTFTMDADHGTYANSVWNDDTNITSSIKVIPRIVTVTLSGIQPQTNDDGTLVDQRLEVGSGEGVYLYYVPGTTTPDEVSSTIHLEALGTDSNYSITLSTSQISPNPNLYETLTLTGGITKSTVNDLRFVGTESSTTAITQVLGVANKDVWFYFVYGGNPASVKFQLTGLVPADARVTGPDSDGYYTFTPTGNNAAQHIHFRTSDASTNPVRLTNFTVDSEDYDQPATRNYQLSRFLYTFGTNGFYKSTANNAQTMTVITNAAGSTVYYRFTYDSDESSPFSDVTITSTGLTNPTSTTGTLTANGDHTWTYHPNTNNRTQWITWTTEAVASPSTSTVTVSADTYSNAPTASIKRRVSRTVEFVPGDFTESDHSASKTKNGLTLSLSDVEVESGYVQLGYYGTIFGGGSYSGVASFSGGEIQEIALTFVNESNYNKPSSVTSDPSGWSSQTSKWTGSSSTVTLTSARVGGNSLGSRYNRVTKFTVTFYEE
ncbi:MAG: hypothetical protein IJT26_02475 [Bacteroidales bacterium]|nr:hypothetical protein [Bacteroidales bacterium]